MDEVPTLYTAEEAAKALRVRQSWLERQAAARKIPFTMLGGSYRFTAGHLAQIVHIFEAAPAPAAVPATSTSSGPARPVAARPLQRARRRRYGPARGRNRWSPESNPLDRSERMAYAEKRGNLWRARWRGPDGTLESKSGFRTRKAAEDHAHDQAAAIRNNTYVDARAGRITLTEWVNLWFPALDLEPTTMNNYRYMIEVHILPAFGDRTLGSLTAEEVAVWEINLVTSGLTRRTAHDARSTLATVLADAVPRYITVNPAARRRGKGRKGQRRIERIEKKRKAWATPLQALLTAERAAVLTGRATDFVMMVTLAYTGMRWSEAIGLPPDCIRDSALDIHWKLYELNGRFYRGRPKDGSMRTADLPPFLSELLAGHLEATPHRTCSCREQDSDGDDIEWCAGSEYVFLGPQRGHFRRSNYSERVMRPAADGWYPARKGSERPSKDAGPRRHRRRLAREAAAAMAAGDPWRTRPTCRQPDGDDRASPRTPASAHGCPSYQGSHRTDSGTDTRPGWTK